MNAIEKQEIEKLDPKYRPLGAWAYFGYSLLFALPIVGFICLIVFAFNSGNIIRRSYARSFFCGLLIAAIIIGVIAIIGITTGLINFAAIADMITGTTGVA